MLCGCFWFYYSRGFQSCLLLLSCFQCFYVFFYFGVKSVKRFIVDFVRGHELGNSLSDVLSQVLLRDDSHVAWLIAGKVAGFLGWSLAVLCSGGSVLQHELSADELAYGFPVAKEGLSELAVSRVSRKFVRDLGWNRWWMQGWFWASGLGFVF